MHFLRRPTGGWVGPGLRDRMPYRRDQLRRPRRHGCRSQKENRGGARDLHSGDLWARRGRRHQRAAPFVRAVRTDRLHYWPAEDADARPHAPMAACHGARVRCVVRAVCCVELDRASAHAPSRARRRAHMNWRIRLTWWDKLLLAIMAVGPGLALRRFADRLRTV